MANVVGNPMPPRMLLLLPVFASKFNTLVVILKLLDKSIFSIGIVGDVDDGGDCSVDDDDVDGNFDFIMTGLAKLILL